MIARVLVTTKCNRSCAGCCNTYTSTMKQAKFITSIEQVLDHEIICITGGEPMLYPDKVLKLVTDLRNKWNYAGKIFLYTALWEPQLPNIIDHIDGVHYTLHEGADYGDVCGFYAYQDYLVRLQKKEKKVAKRLKQTWVPTRSFRAYIDPRVTYTLTVRPWVYSRLEIKQWMDEGNCPLPQNEELFIMRKF